MCTIIYDICVHIADPVTLALGRQPAVLPAASGLVAATAAAAVAATAVAATTAAAGTVALLHVYVVQDGVDVSNLTLKLLNTPKGLCTCQL